MFYWWFMMFHDVLQMFHDVLLCFTMFSESCNDWHQRLRCCRRRCIGNHAAGSGNDTATKVIPCKTSSWMETGVTLLLEDKFQRGLSEWGSIKECNKYPPTILNICGCGGHLRWTLKYNWNIRTAFSHFQNGIRSRFVPIPKYDCS